MRCPLCNLPLFIYKLTHNGVQETVTRCVNFHDKSTTPSCAKKGPEENFRALYSTRKF